MRKINLTEASSVVGGTSTVCTDKYSWVSIGGKFSCRQVKTCTDKNGVQTMNVANEAPGRCGPL